MNQPSPIAEFGPVLRPSRAAQRLAIGLSTLWLKAKKEADFPKPIRLGPRITAFRIADLDAWLTRQACKTA